jgi:hypothetical protein
VLHFTHGEMFFPMPVDEYLRDAALWKIGDKDSPPLLLVEHGNLRPEVLSEMALEHPETLLFLRYAPRSLQRRELREWRRNPDRPKFSGISRLAAVGLLGRIIDSGMRLSLNLRGKVPGGLAAAAQQQYAARTAIDAYHAHVSTSGGYVIVQYWFLYAMNDWRSSFSGVNDHESDWEQVTMYLVPQDDELKVAWIAFSSHDETGDELRRRADDPDIRWVDGTHAVVNAGAGSHSGAYLAGDYLVRVQPPALARVFAIVTRLRSLLFPWTRHQESLGVGIPYVDYRRGDGVRIGPGTGRPWTPILIDAKTPWVRDFRGLWGLDTADPFGGERAPAGPRYERNGKVRASWGDPVGWAGLDKVPPTPADAIRARTARTTELDEHIAGLDGQIGEAQDELRRAAAGIDILSTEARRGRDGPTARLAAQEQAAATLQSQRREAISERDQLRNARHHDAPPHAHLRHRAVPDTHAPSGILLRFWSGASLSVLLVLLGLALLLNLGSLLVVIVAAVLIVMAVEALLRRKLLLFLLGLATTAGAGVLIWLFITHLRVAFGVLALVAAAAIGIANLRTLAR